MRFLINRRELVRSGIVLGAGTAALRASAQNPYSGEFSAYAQVRAPTWSMPLTIPKVLAPARQEDGADVYEVEVKRGTAQPLKGAPTAILGLDGSWPGPTIQAVRGRPVRVRVKNALEESLSLHNHGIKTRADSDGHPTDYIRPGAVKEYLYPNDQPGGTLWYHDHAMALTSEHVYRGFAGFYLIRDPAEDALGLPSGEFDVPLLVQDRQFDSSNALMYSADAGTLNTGFLGNAICVNGVHGPVMDVAPRRYRFRILNGANARTLRLALSSGDPLMQVASDARLLEAPVRRESIDLMSSERCDCVVDFSRHEPGTSIVLRNLDPTWPELPEVMRFDVKGAREKDPSRLPAKLARVPRLSEKGALKRTVVLGLQDGKWTLNGLRYDPTRIDFRPMLGTTEVWTLRNAEPTQAHPFHQHLVPFQVLDIDGVPPPPELRGWKDSVRVGPGSTVRIIMRFEGYPGVYVFHCHKLEHEDHAMMLQQEVVA
jgi:spore coat protein A, manganese oxidase